MSLRPKDMTEAKRFIVQLECGNKFLLNELDQLANFNPDWDMLETTRESLVEYIEMYKASEQKLNEQIAYSELLEGFVVKCVRVYSWEGDVVDGGDIQDWADELGIIKEVAFDSSKHDDGGISMDEGDPFYELANQSPAQSLANHDADVIKTMLDTVISYDETSIGDPAYSYDSLIEYANQLLKEGE